jgi:hypothetical protein
MPPAAIPPEVTVFAMLGVAFIGFIGGLAVAFIAGLFNRQVVQDRGAIDRDLAAIQDQLSRLRDAEHIRLEKYTELQVAAIADLMQKQSHLVRVLAGVAGAIKDLPVDEPDKLDWILTNRNGKFVPLSFAIDDVISSTTASLIWLDVRATRSVLGVHEMLQPLREILDSIESEDPEQSSGAFVKFAALVDALANQALTANNSLRKMLDPKSEQLR